MLTSIPGASEYFLGGVIAYDAAIKERVLGVPAEIIQSDGVVSQACAEAMALGVQELCGARVSLAVTGEAGPTPADPDVEVGTVWVAFCIDDLRVSRMLKLKGDRNEIRSQTAAVAVTLLTESILSHT
jgi:PncC family amidohydrolase